MIDMTEMAHGTPADALRTAAYNGNLPGLCRLLEEQVDPNVCDKWGRTALSLAAGRGHLKVVEKLIAAGAWVDPHEDYDTHETPLIAAAENGHLPTVRVLIEAGANPRHFGGIGQATAEVYARSNGYREVSDFLRALAT